MKTIMAFGTFDILHPGHINFLRQAKSFGNLITVIARDRTVYRVKGQLPRHNESERQRAVKFSGIADKVILGSLTDKYAAIKKYRPDVIALGYDQKFFVAELESELKKLNLNTKIIRLKSFQPKKYKSSILKNEKQYPEKEIRTVYRLQAN